MGRPLLSMMPPPFPMTRPPFLDAYRGMIPPPPFGMMHQGAMTGNSGGGGGGDSAWGPHGHVVPPQFQDASRGPRSLPKPNGEVSG